MPGEDRRIAFTHVHVNAITLGSKRDSTGYTSLKYAFLSQCSGTCGNSVYQALLSPRDPGYKARARNVRDKFRAGVENEFNAEH